jgi:hypothetical protein
VIDMRDDTEVAYVPEVHVGGESVSRVVLARTATKIVRRNPRKKEACTCPGAGRRNVAS